MWFPFPNKIPKPIPVFLGRTDHLSSDFNTLSLTQHLQTVPWANSSGIPPKPFLHLASERCPSVPCPFPGAEQSPDTTQPVFNSRQSVCTTSAALEHRVEPQLPHLSSSYSTQGTARSAPFLPSISQPCVLLSESPLQKTLPPSSHLPQMQVHPFASFCKISSSHHNTQGPR